MSQPDPQSPPLSTSEPASTAPAPLASPGAQRAQSAQASAVHVDSVTRVFGRGASQVVALDDVSLTVAPGEFVSLIGPSGCGKSTLLRLVADLDQPTSGTVEVFGRPARQARLSREYGIAFQQAGLLPWRTVRANVEAPARAVRHRARSPEGAGRPPARPRRAR